VQARTRRIVEGVRHSMRVTRLRDLVEISPDLWAGPGAARGPGTTGDGQAQAGSR
jgi:hypothetical protein